MNPVIQFRKAALLPLILSTFACLGLLPKAQAVSPPPDGGYPGGNTAEGQNALFSLTTGGFNTAVGFFSLKSNATGQLNTAIGAGALLVNTADENTATGAGALLNNTTGGGNTAHGAFALFSNTGGVNNTAIGFQALYSNTTGSANTAIGSGTLFSTTGTDNTAMGGAALSSNTTGGDNTANGAFALSSNTTGSANTAIGSGALGSNTTGSFNVALGDSAGGNLSAGSRENIDIGNAGFADDANTIRIGDDAHQSATFIAGIYGVAVSGLTVVMDSSDHLGTVGSSRRFKKEIKPMDKASEALLALNPVTFRYKKEIDSKGIPQFGLVAEDVEKVNPDLIVRDKEGKPYSVRYDAVNAMLLNEFLKEHRKNETQETTLAELKAEIATLSATVKAQAEQIQKVTAQLATASPSGGGLELSKFATGRIRGGGPAPQVVNNL